MIEVSLIIVSYNTKKLLQECLTSVFQYLQDTSFEAIVVDNGSADGSPEMVKSLFPDVKLIETGENLGFAKANNRGLEHAQGEYLLLLNSDTRLKDDSIQKMITFCKEEKDSVVVASKLLLPDGSTQASCQNLPTVIGAKKEFILGRKDSYLPYVPKEKEPVKVESAIAACLLFPKKIFDVVGHFDERYFMYFEDLDLCRRLRNAHVPIYYLPSSGVIHVGGASGKNVPQKTYKMLLSSSYLYHGKIEAMLIHLVIRIGSALQKMKGRPSV